jgi:steroid delta-isomerase-like uncharacterized protein
MVYETILHRWFEEVWNQGKESTIDELWADQVVSHGLADTTGNRVSGPDSFRPFYRQLRSAFPDIRFTIEDTLIDGGKTMVRCRVTGTHTGPGITATPTNKTIDVTGMCLAHLKDGKIVSAWNNFDFLALHRQLGVPLP